MELRHYCESACRNDGKEIQPMKQLHIVTVGISLLTNYEKDTGIGREKALRHAKAVAAFLDKNPTSASAEINALNSRTGFLNHKTDCLGVALVYTHTEEGKLCATTIRKFLLSRGIKVVEIKLPRIELPADGRVDLKLAQDMAGNGLRDLRAKVSDHVRKMRKQNCDLRVEMNVTGGYKAETAVLYGLGRDIGAVVYYLHETYRTVIELP